MSTLKMTKNKWKNFSGKKDLLTKGSSKTSTKSCILKWNSKTLKKSSKEFVKNYLILTAIKIKIDSGF
jgi:hypothetical protein